jgi:hypothetical protein
VIYVDSLADSLDPGTLRYALSVATGPRTVIFRVSGYITLLDDIGIFDPFITIAGQTAPGGGVCVRNGSISIRTHDVIIRHLRVRPGDAAFPGETASNPQDRDCIKIEGGNNIILDHCSLSWSVDENFSTWVLGGVYPHSITVQNSIIAEGLYASIHPEGNHSRGFLVGDGVTKLTSIHNFHISNNRRNPMIKGATSDIEIVNNIIYNWGPDTNSPAGVGVNFSDVEGSGATNAAIVNNIFGQGPNLGTSPMSFDTVNAASQILLGGNTGDMDDAAIIAAFPYVFAAPAFDDPDLNWTAAQILADVGAMVPGLDAVDTRLLLEAVTNGGAIIDSPSDVGGYPTLASGTPYVDSDLDGMDDSWERDNGTIVGIADNNGFIKDNGYTNLENYLNQLAGDPVTRAASGDDFEDLKVSVSRSASRPRISRSSNGSRIVRG